MDSEPELRSLISEMLSVLLAMDSDADSVSDSDSQLTSKLLQLSRQIISLLSSMNLYSEQKPESKLISLIKQVISFGNSISDSGPESKLVALVTRMISLINTMESNSDEKQGHESELRSLSAQIYPHIDSLDSDSELMSLILKIFCLNPKYLEPESKLKLVISQLLSFFRSKDYNQTDADLDSDSPPSKFISLTIQLISLISSMDLDSQPKPETELMSLIKQIISSGKSGRNWGRDSQLVNLVSLVTQMISLISTTESDPDPKQVPSPELRSLATQIFSCLNSLDWSYSSELLGLFNKIAFIVNSTVSYSEPEQEPESKLISLITQLMSLTVTDQTHWGWDSKVISLSIEMISLVISMDLDSQPKPESELMSLTKQAISLFNSMDLDSQPHPLRKLISIILQELFREDSIDSYSKQELTSNFMDLIRETLELKPEPKLMSLIHQIFSLVVSTNSKWKNLISIRPQVELNFQEGYFKVPEKEILWSSNNKWNCLPLFWKKFRLRGGEDPTHFLCQGCIGKNHEEHNKAPIVIKHLLHPKHHLHLVLTRVSSGNKKCYCCGEALKSLFYHCKVCDYALNMACAEKPPVLSIYHPKWHEHTLALFPTRDSVTCTVCALTHSSCPFYVCPPCDFLVHQNCISLPRAIRISRHPHRISFTPSFDQGDWCCGVCRRKINTDYGGFTCIKKGCSYAVHSRCATQSNVWDGIDLDGVPEEIEEEEVAPFETISDGIIKHFSHAHHHLRLGENTAKEYDENKICQACITPIYFGNFYSCIQCDYILHKKCAELSHKLHHPIHPHLLTLVGGYDRVIDYNKDICSVCPSLCKVGFFYECGKKGCHFQLHVQCATISEPLVHVSHIHPLFLTSKPGEKRRCCVCYSLGHGSTKETFNCVEECDFALCFTCATLPQKVRYKHDKHMFTLSYGEGENIMTHWCEVCEGKIKPRKGFYMCDEYCYVTLHIKCLLGKDFYMKPDSTWIYGDTISTICNHHMSRPLCSYCQKRCPQKIAFQILDSISCSITCVHNQGGRNFEELQVKNRQDENSLH